MLYCTHTHTKIQLKRLPCQLFCCSGRMLTDTGTSMPAHILLCGFLLPFLPHGSLGPDLILSSPFFSLLIIGRILRLIHATACSYRGLLPFTAGRHSLEIECNTAFACFPLKDGHAQQLHHSHLLVEPEDTKVGQKVSLMPFHLVFYSCLQGTCKHPAWHTVEYNKCILNQYCK